MKHYCSFSEAIREGAKLGPQAFGALVDGKGTCATGAGLQALGVYSESKAYALFPYLLTELASCPSCHSRYCSPYIYGVILHLNDYHRWTREAIADWLEKEEEKLGYVLITEEENETAVTNPVPVAAVY